jgi:hypothetical protein
MRSSQRQSIPAPSHRLRAPTPALLCPCHGIAADMYQAADNLHARLTHELSRHVEMLELVEAAQAAGKGKCGSCI